jgi:hypothetical protein
MQLPVTVKLLTGATIQEKRKPTTELDMQHVVASSVIFGDETFFS